MKFDIAAIFNQFVSSYVRLPFAQKIAIPFLIAGSVIVIVFVSRWAGQAQYGVLYSGLDQTDASGVVERLKDQKIGFRLRDDGATVEVTPPKLVPELRLEFAAAGLPRGGSVGFELFNENTLGRTGFVERLTHVRAVQGELERTIQSIDAVKSVRVHVTNPPKSVFVSRDVKPTASVLLRIKAGEELAARQVKGIAYLVAHSVERLTPENVTVLDSRGNILNEQQDSEEFAGVDSTKLEYKKGIEKEYARRIETMLAGILGPGKAMARVTADLDFSKYEKEEEAYDPGGQVIRSARSVQESSGLTAEGGVPGVVANLTNEPGLLTPPDSSKNSNLRSETVTNYEVSRAISKTVSSAGSLKKLSVAVLVDGQYLPASDGKKRANGEVVNYYQPLGAEMIRKIENLVKQTVGFDSVRGDVVTVENIRFFVPDETLVEALDRADNQQFIFEVLSWAVPLLFIVLFIFVVVRPLVRFLVRPTEAEVDLSRLLPSGVEDLEAELESERTKLTAAAPEAELPHVDIEELEELLGENSRMVKESPQQAALLIRYWLNEGRPV